MSSSVTANDGNIPSDACRDSNVITQLTLNDILMGRGAPIINYEGNVRFRALVSTRKKEYNSTGRHQIKDEIARQIVLEVKRRNGRFLRKLDSSEELRLNGIPEAEPAWIIADEEVILEKVKQALRDKEPEKRIAQSQSFESTTTAGNLPNTAGQTSNFPIISTPGSSNWAGEHLHLLQNSPYRQIALSNLLPQSSVLNHQNSSGALSASSIARRQSESDLDILRQQQHEMQQQSLLSNITSFPNISSRTYLNALLQQGHNTSLASLSTRPDQRIPSNNETLLSILGVDFHRPNDASTHLSAMRTQAPSSDETSSTTYGQNRNETVISSTFPMYASLGLTNLPTLNSIRALQQYTAAATARQEQQQRHELHRQILLDPSIRARYLAASRIPQQINSNVHGSHNSDAILTASLPIGQRPSNGNVDIMNSAERLSSKPEDSKFDQGESVERSSNEGRKRNSSGETESSEASTTIEGTKKKSRVYTNRSIVKK